jgi:hypothetical protein
MPRMDVSELRKRILHALDDARRDAEGRRQGRGDAEKHWERFLPAPAVPLFRQAATVLKAEGHLFSVHTPASSVRLVSDGSPETYLEVVLDSSEGSPRMVGRLSVSRGRGRQTLEEQPIATDKAVVDVTEDDLARFLVTEVPKLIVRG